MNCLKMFNYVAKIGKMLICNLKIILIYKKLKINVLIVLNLETSTSFSNVNLLQLHINFFTP